MDAISPRSMDEVDRVERRCHLCASPSNCFETSALQQDHLTNPIT